MNEPPDATTKVLAAIAAITDQPLSDLTDAFHTHPNHPAATPAHADPDDVRRHLHAVITRLHLAPALNPTDRQHHLNTLTDLTHNPPTQTVADLTAWSHLLRHTPEAVPTLTRTPVRLPALNDPQHEAWATLIDLENDPARTEPWVLVGGQMVLLHTLEHGLAPHRVTNDGDIIVGVWTRRDALKNISRFLTDRHFTLTATADKHGYRYEHDDAQIDLLIPEGLERQTHPPRTHTGQPGLPVEGGNQALIRAERVPVTLGDKTGHIRRPNILGALICKACALVADNRDSERHAEDIAILSQIALTDLRAINDSMTPKDRRRLRRALTAMDNPRHSHAWTTADHPDDARNALHRLAHPRT